MNRQLLAMSGLAMVLVVLNHTIDMAIQIPVRYGFPPVEGWLRQILDLIRDLGVLAVPTFLFISGSFFSYAARGVPRKLTAACWIQNLRHLGWPYLFWSSMFYFIVYLQFGEGYTLPGYAKNLVVGYPYHFIPLLALFYLLSPLLVKLGERHSISLILFTATYQLLLLSLLNTELLPAKFSVLVPRIVGRTLADWAIFFPLGLVFGMRKHAILPLLKKLKTPMIISTIVSFVLSAFYDHQMLAILPAVIFVMLLPVINRSSVPLSGLLEEIGKRSYGLYLTHLVVLDLVLWGIVALVPGLVHHRVALQPLLFLVALTVPLLVMKGLAHSPVRSIYRYVMG